MFKNGFHFFLLFFSHHNMEPRPAMLVKNSGCFFENEYKINNDAVLVDFAFPGGTIVNTACVYGPSHKDDKDFWELVKSQLYLRNSPGGK